MPRSRFMATSPVFIIQNRCSKVKRQVCPASISTLLHSHILQNKEVAPSATHRNMTFVTSLRVLP